MGYQLSLEQFQSSKMFDSKGKLYHKSGNRFKLFPFVTQPNSVPVTELGPLIGSFLCRVEEKKPKEITAAELVEKLKQDTEIQAGQEELFFEMIRQLFFTVDGSLRPMNLQMIEQMICSETTGNRIAEYLVDVLGSTESLKKSLTVAKNKNSGNVLESFVLSKLEFEDQIHSNEGVSYFRIVESLKSCFEEDFAYIVEDPRRLREYLVLLLELYFFSYTAQTSLQLSRFMDGERDSNIPLYFCLEWEKTSQSRLCFTEGWQKLQGSIEKIFAHAITLEILNQTNDGSELVDYIRLGEIVSNEEMDREISGQIDHLTALYRASITDCVEMTELEKKDSPAGFTSSSLKFLYDSIRVQFENTVRNRAYSSYANKFESYCKKYLKSRGRSGLMLNLSEEDLIFITKLCIKDPRAGSIERCLQGLRKKRDLPRRHFKRTSYCVL